MEDREDPSQRFPYDEDLADRLIDHVMQGNSIQGFAFDNHLDGPHIFYYWAASNEDFAERLVDARVCAGLSNGDRVTWIMEQVERGLMTENRATTFFKMLSWNAEKLAPHIYAHQQRVKHVGGDPDDPTMKIENVSLDMSVDDMTEDQRNAFYKKYLGFAPAD